MQRYLLQTERHMDNKTCKAKREVRSPVTEADSPLKEILTCSEQQTETAKTQRHVLYHHERK